MFFLTMCQLFNEFIAVIAAHRPRWGEDRHVLTVLRCLQKFVLSPCPVCLSEITSVWTLIIIMFVNSQNLIAASSLSLKTTSVGLCRHNDVILTHVELHSYGRRAFSVAGPAIRNWLPDSQRDPAISRDSFKRSLRTFLCSVYSCT